MSGSRHFIFFEFFCKRLGAEYDKFVYDIIYKIFLSLTDNYNYRLIAVLARISIILTRIMVARVANE